MAPVVGEVGVALGVARAVAMVAEVAQAEGMVEAETEAVQSTQGDSQFLPWSPPTCQGTSPQASANNNSDPVTGRLARRIALPNSSGTFGSR